MTTFEELQAAHERLLEQSTAPPDVAAFVKDVQREIQAMGMAAADISAPRERDQLRAIMRFWASYVYDHTGTYPDTTLQPALQPARSAQPASNPPRSSRSRIPLLGIALAAGAAFIVLLALLSSWGTMQMVGPAAVSTPNGSAQVEATAEPPSAPSLEIQWNILTAGPSPFDPNAWAVKLQLGATGGNDSYIFWVDGIRLPDISENHFTVEGAGCEPQIRVVGVTSGGQATSLELTIHSPLSGCPQPPPK